MNGDDSHEYWLERSDPLLNTILPGTGVSLVLNFGDPWTAGRSLVTFECLSPACVIGPVTQARILHVGRSVRAVGAVVPATVASSIFDVPAEALVDRIVPLDDLWAAGRLFASIGELDVRRGLAVLRDALVTRHSESPAGMIAERASRLIQRHGGRVSIEAMARAHGLRRQLFARRFCAEVGLPPKLFARITRFQRLIHGLLSTDVKQWATVAPAAGFYDQAHMINEFRELAGCPPTVFFRPHGGTVDSAQVRLCGRPSEWLRPPGALEGVLRRL